MGKTTHTNRTVVATLDVRVPVHASGDLVTAGTRIVERADAVDHVVDAMVRGLEPGLNDTTVVLEVRLDVVGERGEDLAVLRRDLERAVGVCVNELLIVDGGAESDEVALKTDTTAVTS